ncbi:MAG: DUF167 domain-containing protein [Acidobacteria bacterium]|nr:DUF167 domain-containing protein [Acidobacteriota bacterium]
MIRSTATGVELDVRVIPRSGKPGVDGERDGRLLVRLSAPPVEGAANEALVELLSRLLACPRRAVRIVSGQKNRSKRVAVDGISVATATQLLRRTP